MSQNVSQTQTQNKPILFFKLVLSKHEKIHVLKNKEKIAILYVESKWTEALKRTLMSFKPIKRYDLVGFDRYHGRLLRNPAYIYAFSPESAPQLVEKFTEMAKPLFVNEKELMKAIERLNKLLSQVFS